VAAKNCTSFTIILLMSLPRTKFWHMVTTTFTTDQKYYAGFFGMTEHIYRTTFILIPNQGSSSGPKVLAWKLSTTNTECDRITWCFCHSLRWRLAESRYFLLKCELNSSCMMSGKVHHRLHKLAEVRNY
jgi:hypothetical protein